MNIGPSLTRPQAFQTDGIQPKVKFNFRVPGKIRKNLDNQIHSWPERIAVKIQRQRAYIDIGPRDEPSYQMASNRRYLILDFSASHQSYTSKQQFVIDAASSHLQRPVTSNRPTPPRPDWAHHMGQVDGLSTSRTIRTDATYRITL